MIEPPASSRPNHQANSNPSRYQLIREIVRNTERGKISYLAIDKVTQQQVILKRFTFSQTPSPREGYEAYRQEFIVLRGLNHPGIPRYLDFFETADGFCIVQQYKNAQSLAELSNLNLEEIKQIAISVLKILAYLQNSSPPIIHRDIQPEHILVDEHRNVYLVDFGFVTGQEKLAYTRVAGRKFGIIAPEQLNNRKITEAADIYNLGATIICLLTKTKSTRLYTLVDKQGRIKFQHLVPNNFSLHFINWLDTLVQPNRAERYPNAAAALEALKAIDITRLPEVKFIPSSLEIKSTKPGEIITKTITVTNPIPETLLEGNWQVARHKSDPFMTDGSHAWISFKPAKFKNNHAKCKVIIDTSRLMVDQIYQRQILVHTNANPETHSVNITVQTAAIAPRKLPYLALATLFISALFGGWLEAWVIGGFNLLGWGLLLAGLILGSVAGWGAAFNNKDLLIRVCGIACITGIGVGTLVSIGTIELGLVGFIVGFIVGLAVAIIGGNVVKNHSKRKFSQRFATVIAFLTTILGMSLGIGLVIGFINPFIKFAVIAAALPLVTIIVTLVLKQIMVAHKYHLYERELIKP